MAGVHSPLPPELEGLATKVVDAAFRVHTQLGPGLLESVYETCLCHEITKSGIPIQRQQMIPIIYDSIHIEAGLRLDLLVSGELIVEIKSVVELHKIHTAQLLTYLKLSNKRLGLLINFNEVLIKNGIKRVIL